MVVGVAKIEFFLPQCHSLKEKRQILKSLMARTQNRHNISIAEVDFHDLWQRCAVGISCVSREEHQVRQTLSRIEEALHNLDEAIVVSHQTTFYHPEK
jgi:uncharacterized protein YlxP (DUF503 family)